jgi:hypothetical protein
MRQYCHFSGIMVDYSTLPEILVVLERKIDL